MLNDYNSEDEDAYVMD